MTRDEDRPLSVNLYFKEIMKIPLLTDEEELEVGRRARLGDPHALERLITANLRFAAKIAYQYERSLGIPIEDLISFANEGLRRAAKKFDERRGAPFIGYAVSWIRQIILVRSIGKERVVPLPIRRAALPRLVGKTIERLSKEKGSWPSIEEVAAALPDESPDDVRECVRFSKADFSLDESFGNGNGNGSGDETYLDMLPDGEDQADLIANTITREKLKRELMKELSKLTEREAMVLRLYYGNVPLSFRTIGEHFGVKRQRIHHLHNRALDKIRKRRPDLKDFLKDFT